MLLRLPNELIRIVLSKLHRRDLINVSTCSQVLHSLATPILYSNLVLPVSDKFNTELGRWKLLADQGLIHRLLHDERKYWKYVRRLRVVLRERIIEEPDGEAENRFEADKNSDVKVDEKDILEGDEGGVPDGEGQDNFNEEEEDDEEGENESEDGTPIVGESDEDPTSVVASQISSLIEIDKTRLTSFKWLLNSDIPPNLFQKLVEVPGNFLSTLEILSHGYHGSVGTLPEGSLPCLRKLVVQGIYSPRRVAELHYILRASPGLQSFGFSLGEEASPEVQDFSFRFHNSEMAGIGLEADDFGWEEAPTHWTDFIETCIFKNLKMLPLKELMVGGIRLTSKMAKCLPLESLRHLHLRDLGTSFDFIQALDIENLQLETCHIVYERIGEECLFRKFIGDLRPGLRHLGFICTAWDVDSDITDHGLESEYPGLFSLPEEFTERQKGTLETLTFNVLISDWQVYKVTPDHSRNFQFSSKFSKATEISVPLLLTKTKMDIKLPKGPTPMQTDLKFWVPMPIPLDEISVLPNLHVLTLNPISAEYRGDFIESIFEPNIHFRQWVDTYQKGLDKYVEDLAGTYATKYGQAFGLDHGPPPLKWIFVVGGDCCHLEVGFQIKWSLGEGKHDALITMLSGVDARKLVKTEDMRFRKFGMPN